MLSCRPDYAEKTAKEMLMVSVVRAEFNDGRYWYNPKKMIHDGKEKRIYQCPSQKILQPFAKCLPPSGCI